MKRFRKVRMSRKGWALLLLPVLAVAGAFVVMNSSGASGGKPGSDVLGTWIDRKEQSGVSMGKKPTTGPAWDQSNTSSGSSGSTDSASVTGSAGTSSGALPPSPEISDAPDDVTFAVDAHFRYSHAEPGVRFQCQLDGGQITNCNKGTADYKKLDTRDHVFRVWALNNAGRSANFDEHRWTILIKRDFGITGDATQVLYLGATTKLDLRISNPFNFAIRVLSIAVTAEDEPGCPATNLEAIPAVFDSPSPVVVPANSARSLSDFPTLSENAWPKLRMVDSNTNQDSCKNVNFTLNYEGTATKA